MVSDLISIRIFSDDDMLRAEAIAIVEKVIREFIDNHEGKINFNYKIERQQPQITIK